MASTGADWPKIVGEADIRSADRRVTESDLTVTEPRPQKEPPPPPAGPAYSDVTIMRNLKSQDYKVVRGAH